MSLRYLSHQVWHKIDESSPLYRLRSKLHMYIDGIEVSVTAVDMASLQTVMFYKRYEKSDFIRGACFVNTLRESGRRTASGGKQLVTDHAKLDEITREDTYVPADDQRVHRSARPPPPARIMQTSSCRLPPLTLHTCVLYLAHTLSMHPTTRDCMCLQIRAHAVLARRINALAAFLRSSGKPLARTMERSNSLRRGLERSPSLRARLGSARSSMAMSDYDRQSAADSELSVSRASSMRPSVRASPPVRPGLHRAKTLAGLNRV